jgi:hypothetical protein
MTAQGARPWPGAPERLARWRLAGEGWRGRAGGRRGYRADPYAGPVIPRSDTVRLPGAEPGLGVRPPGPIGPAKWERHGGG